MLVTPGIKPYARCQRWNVVVRILAAAAIGLVIIKRQRAILRSRTYTGATSFRDLSGTVLPRDDAALRRPRELGTGARPAAAVDRQALTLDGVAGWLCSAFC